jgi:hypothetical protein
MKIFSRVNRKRMGAGGRFRDPGNIGRARRERALPAASPLPGLPVNWRRPEARRALVKG